MSGFYKMDPAAWDFGTANLSLEEEAAYLRIINAIHKHDAAVPDNDRILAGLFRTSTRKARALVNALIEAGKLTIEDGKIWNDRARSDLVQRGFVTISRAESGAKGGRTRAENAAKALKNNDAGQAIASSRIEENREEKKETTVSLEKPPRRKPEIPLPEGWIPSERNIADAYDRNFTSQEIERHAEQFRNHHASKQNRYRDWDAAWRTWLGNADRFKPTATRNAGPSGGHSSLFAGFQRAAAGIN